MSRLEIYEDILDSTGKVLNQQPMWDNLISDKIHVDNEPAGDLPDIEDILDSTGTVLRQQPMWDSLINAVEITNQCWQTCQSQVPH
jgi:hypothetical protein